MQFAEVVAASFLRIVQKLRVRNDLDVSDLFEILRSFCCMREHIAGTVYRGYPLPRPHYYGQYPKQAYEDVVDDHDWRSGNSKATAKESSSRRTNNAPLSMLLVS
jgi:hypothetical protein